ncbi:hypothetical protein E2C01_033249 [Portunus trituberculatus]|uniref:Uncharacterized protein n=1 Tax=Portunus trituberculatus TaxID=210409 RepID=A0A5B7F522_PORTR|nr:hypothetical protein [Portunus trituberculatus]
MPCPPSSFLPLLATSPIPSFLPTPQIFLLTFNTFRIPVPPSRPPASRSASSPPLSISRRASPHVISASSASPASPRQLTAPFFTVCSLRWWQKAPAALTLRSSPALLVLWPDGSWKRSPQVIQQLPRRYYSDETLHGEEMCFMLCTHCFCRQQSYYLFRSLNKNDKRFLAKAFTEITSYSFSVWFCLRNASPSRRKLQGRERRPSLPSAAVILNEPDFSCAMSGAPHASRVTGEETSRRPRVWPVGAAHSVPGVNKV